MEKIIAYCGLTCTECPAFIATKNNDDVARKKVAEQWSKQFNVALNQEDINCDGCLIESDRMFGHCRVCEIRKCARERNLKNCGYCPDYGCEKVAFILKARPDAKKILDDIKASR